MTGSTAKSSEDSSSHPVKKHLDNAKHDSSLLAVARMEIDMVDSPATSKESAADGQDGLLDDIDEYPAEFSSAAGKAFVKTDQEEQVAVKSPKRNIPNKKFFDNPEALSLHNDDADHIKIDISLVNTDGDKKEIAKSAKADSNKSKATDKTNIKNKMFWVCNILPSTKASELKTHFSKHAKITTARVVTNGRKYYGCLTVEDEESVKECIKQSNKTTIDGQEIKVQANAPDNEDDSTDDQQIRTNHNNINNNNNKRACVEKYGSSEGRSRPIRKFDKQSEKPDLLTRVIKSPEKAHSKSKEGQQERPSRSKRRRSRSTSIESETRKKVLELRRLTADVEEMQRRKERMITEEKEKERDRRENERIQEMRRKMEEERAHKRMEIELAKKKLEFERKLLEKERDAFMKLRNIEMEELRIRSETKRKIEEAEEYQRKAARKMSKDRERKVTPSPKRYQQHFDSSKQHRGNNRSHSPNLYQSSQQFDIKPLKRDDEDKYPTPPKISSSINYNQRSSNKSTADHNNYYTQKEHRYKNNSNSNSSSNKYSCGGNKSPNEGGKSDAQEHLASYGQSKATSTWLPSALSLSTGNYRQQLMNDHHGGGHRGEQSSMQMPWQQQQPHGSSSSGGKLGGGGRYHEQQQQQQQQQPPYHHGGGMRHQIQYPPQPMDGVAIAGGKGTGRSGGGYQGGRRY